MRDQHDRAISARLLVVGCLTAACAAPPPAAHEESPATPASPLPVLAAPPRPRPTFRTATGRLAAFDKRERLLTVESVAGSSSYRVAADARAWLGRRRLAVSDLAWYVGAQVTLAFGEVDGIRTTHTVRLAEGERPQRAH